MSHIERRLIKVWIHDGELKIIPLEDFTSHDPPALSIPSALSHVRQAIRSEGTTATLFTDEKMNAAIRTKLAMFPESLSEQRHLAKVSIPRVLAQVIHRNPQLIAPAVQEFQSSSSIQFKVTRPSYVRMTDFRNSGN